MDHFRIVFQVFQDHKINTMFSKYEFWLRSVVFLVILCLARFVR